VSTIPTVMIGILALSKEKWNETADSGETEKDCDH